MADDGELPHGITEHGVEKWYKLAPLDHWK